jgi:uncharacterized repeat protein (TIGR01451 family)
MKRLYPLVLCIFLARLGFAQCGFTITINPSSISCNGGSDGSLVASPGGGTGPFNYIWKAGSGNTVIGTNDTLTGLVAGAYKVIVSDLGAGCTDSVTYTLTQPTPIAINPSFMMASCGQPNGYIYVTPSGGTGPYIYSIVPNFGGGGNGFFSSLMPGTYTVSVTDASSCTTNTVVNIIDMPGPIATATSTPSHCGLCDGTATVMPAGGTPPYTYVWNATPTQTTQVAQGLCGNSTYTCTVMDAMGCVFSTATSVQSSSIGSLTATAVPSACGQSNGSISLTAPAGMVTPILYSIQGGSQQLSPNFPNLSPGIYAVAVTDSNGCQLTSNVIVNDSTMNVQLNTTMPSCNMCDGAISTNIIGGAGPYTYQWSNGAATPNVSALCTGNYYVEVTDTNGCYSAVQTGLAPPAAPVIQVDTLINASCSSTTGSVQVSATGGTGPYTYMWQPGGNTTANPALVSGSYTVTVTDAGGCSSNLGVYVANTTNIYIYAANQHNPNCTGNGSISVNALGGVPPYSFAWSNGATTNAITGLTTGTYSVVVTDQNGCSGLGSFNLPGACLNVIKGHLYNDLDQSCTQNGGETDMAWTTVGTAGGYYGFTGVNGDYMIMTPEMNPLVSVYPGYNSSYLTTSCPAAGFIPVSFSQLGDTVSNADFGFYPDPNYFDLGIHPGWTPGHPGFDKQYWVMVENNGPTAQNAVVTFSYDPILQYDSCNNGGVHNAAQHQIVWTFPNIPAGYHWGSWNSRPMAYFTVPATVSLNQQLYTHFEITPISGDGYPWDNSLTVTEPITGSHDPNEKSVYPAGTGPEGAILRNDSTLMYTIHFQNNGNDTAFTVVVVDTLSPNVDPSTIVPGASSHPYTFDLSGQGVMTWHFDHIMLPDSTTDPVGSNGYFNYTVRQRPNLPFFSEIRNTAYIYFDFNSAIVTNTTLNTIVAPVGLEKLRGENGLILYPNPAANEVTVQFETITKGDMQLRLYSIVGTLVKEQKAANMQTGINSEKMDISGLQNGLYLVEVSDGNTKSVKKLVIQK